MEYPPSFCDGTLYVNTFGGRTLALDAETGRILWEWKSGTKASTPAIAGAYLVVSSHDGSVTGLDRATGKVLWQLKTEAKVESPPVAIEDTRLLRGRPTAVIRARCRDGQGSLGIRHRGTHHLSPSVWQNRLCTRRTPAPSSASTGGTARSSGVRT